MRQHQPPTEPVPPVQRSSIVRTELESSAPEAAAAVQAPGAQARVPSLRIDAALADNEPSPNERTDTGPRSNASQVAVVAPKTQVAPAAADGPRSWRDDVAAWTRATLSGAPVADAPVVPAVDGLVARFELAVELSSVLVLLYGAHLCGERGVAPVEIARLLDRQWDEALGRGALGDHRLARYVDSRVVLAATAQRMLDELPPLTGTLVGEPGPVALLGPCVVVAGDEPLAAVAGRCLGRVGGAILVARDAVDPAELAFEARVYGAAAMLRATTVDGVSSDPTIVVVEDAARADQLGVPRLA